MEEITHQQFHQLITSSSCLHGNPQNPKVFFNPFTNEIIKLIPKSKKFYSTSHYAKRFQVASERLAEMGIFAAKYLRSYYYSALKSYIVVYDFIVGQDLHSLTLSQNPIHYEKIVALLHVLHARNLYFRDFHLGNIIMQPDQNLALIDIDSVFVHRLPLSLKKKARNLLHWFNRETEREYFHYYPPTLIIEAYLAASDLTLSEKKKFYYYVLRKKPDLEILPQGKDLQWEMAKSQKPLPQG